MRDNLISHCDNNNITYFGKKQEKKDILKKLQEKEQINKKVIQSLKNLHEDKIAQKLEECASFVKISECSECGAHITGANFCRQRVCMVCAWRRQARFRVDMMKILEKIDKPDDSYRFLTFTIRNCEFDDLKETIDEMLKGFGKIVQRKVWKDCIAGYVRGTEVTFNEKKNEWHPHIHVIILPKKFVSINAIRNLWKEIMKMNYNPQVHIEKIKNKMAVAETLKYSLKYSFSDKGGNVNEKVLLEMMDAFKNRRLIAFGGIFKTVKAALKIEDIDKQDLTDNDFENHDCKYCNGRITEEIYRFDVTGGIYKLYNPFEFLKGEEK